MPTPTPRSGPRRQPPDVRREQLLDATERVLLERGLADTTVGEATAVAGVAKGTVYLYFPSKADLIAAVRARYLERAAAHLEASIPGDRTAKEQLEQFISAFFEFTADNQELHHLLFHQSGFSERDAFASARQLLTTIVANGIADGSFTAPNPAIATDFALAGIHAALVSVMHGDASDLPAVVADVTSTAMRTLGATQPSSADGAQQQARPEPARDVRRRSS